MNTVEGLWLKKQKSEARLQHLGGDAVLHPAGFISRKTLHDMPGGLPPMRRSQGNSHNISSKA